jgi:small GTP-binding protein
VGDDGVGKTSVLVQYRDSKVGSELPVIIPNFVKAEFVNERKVTIVLWDSACSDGYDEVRPRGYANTDFFVLCFALNDMTTLSNASARWLREIRSHMADKSVVLLAGTKRDARRLSDREISPVRKLIKPRCYFELSSRDSQSVQELFRTIATLVVDPDKVPKLEAEPPPPEDKPPPPEPRKAPSSPPASSTCLLL